MYNDINILLKHFNKPSASFGFHFCSVSLVIQGNVNFRFFIGQLSIFIYFILHNLLTGPEGICRKEMLKIPGELPQLEKILKRFEHEYLLTVTLCGNNK